MNDDDLYDAIKDRGDLETTDAARSAAKATMQTLGERIAHGEAEELADDLPDELAGAISGPGGEPEPFGPEEFVDRVSDREDGADQEAAQRHVRAVLSTVSERANRDEWRDVREQLPGEYAALYEASEEASR